MMGHVIPKQLGLLKDAEKQVVLLSVLRCYCLSTKRKEVLGGHYIVAAIAKTSQTLPTKSSAQIYNSLFFFTLFLKENPQTPINELLKLNHSKNLTAVAFFSFHYLSFNTAPENVQGKLHMALIC